MAYVQHMAGFEIRRLRPGSTLFFGRILLGGKFFFFFFFFLGDQRLLLWQVYPCNSTPIGQLDAIGESKVGRDFVNPGCCSSPACPRIDAWIKVRSCSHLRHKISTRSTTATGHRVVALERGRIDSVCTFSLTLALLPVQYLW